MERLFVHLVVYGIMSIALLIMCFIWKNIFYLGFWLFGITLPVFGSFWFFLLLTLILALSGVSIVAMAWAVLLCHIIPWQALLNPPRKC